MNTKPSFIIVGGGMAGAIAAQTLREEGFDGKITLPSLGPAFDNLPVIKQIRDILSDIAVYSTAERCTP